jgi:hypothetical protein
MCSFIHDYTRHQIRCKLLKFSLEILFYYIFSIGKIFNKTGAPEIELLAQKNCVEL